MGQHEPKTLLYPDLVYVETLVGKDTVNTLPQTTWEALLAHGEVRPGSIEEGTPGG